jgi:hypothetical protein
MELIEIVATEGRAIDIKLSASRIINAVLNGTGISSMIRYVEHPRVLNGGLAEPCFVPQVTFMAVTAQRFGPHLMLIRPGNGCRQSHIIQRDNCCATMRC